MKLSINICRYCLFKPASRKFITMLHTAYIYSVFCKNQQTITTLLFRGTDLNTAVPKSLFVICSL
jgi:hypothetical protein